jgi:hypothetical protein
MVPFPTRDSVSKHQKGKVMTDETKNPTSPVPSSGRPADFAVTLPMSIEDFKDFVTSLLGKPQSISRMMEGPFEVQRENIENLYHLVNQRVNQQNEAHLLQFVVEVVYDDHSTATLNSFQDFKRFNEVRSVVSVAVHLSWTFMVRFQDKTVPEKQVIEVSIVAGPASRAIEVRDGRLSGHGSFALMAGSFMSSRISHTARTWGADLEAMLTGALKCYVTKQHVIKRLISKHSEKVGVGIMAVLFIASLIVAYFTINRFMISQLAELQGLNDPSKGDVAQAKMDYLLAFLASGVWPRCFFYVIVFLIISLVLSIGLGIWVGTAAAIHEPSYLLLTAQSEKEMADVKRKNQRSWRTFILAIATSIVVSSINKIVFAWLFFFWKP